MIPVKVELRNFLSYQKETFDVEKLDSIVLINGINGEESGKDESNGAGKSSLLDAIEWALYGRVRGVFSKELVGDDVIHKNNDGVVADLARVTYIFKLEETYYRILREKAFEGATTLQLFSSSDGGTKWKNLTFSAGVNKRTGKKESSIARTQQRINDILNANCDLFINSVFFEQQNTNTFAVSKNSEREELLREALYLDRWIDYGREAKDRLRAVEKELYAIEYSLNKDNPKELKEKQDELMGAIEDHSKNIKTKEEEIKVVEKAALQLNSKYEKLKQQQENSKEIKENYRRAEGNHENILERSGSNEQQLDDEIHSISGYENEIEVHQEIIDKVEMSNDDIQKKLNKFTTDPKDYTSERDGVRDSISSLKSRATQLTKERDEELGTCPLTNPLCRNHSQDAKDAHKKKLNSLIFSNNKQIVLFEKQLKEIDEKIKKQREENTQLDTLQKTLTKQKNSLQHEKIEVENIKIRIEKAKKTIGILEADKKKIAKELKESEKVLSEAKTKVEELEDLDLQSIEDEIQENHELITSMKERLEELRTLKTKAEASIEVIKARLEELSELQSSANSLQDRKGTLQYTVKMMTKDIPHQLIEAAIPEIETYAQIFIDHLSGGRMNVYFTTQRELQKKDKETKENLTADELGLELEIDGLKKKYALCSGGEKTRADIAIHLAYSAFLINRSGAKLQSLFLDEVASALDKDGKQNLVSLLHRLVNEFGFKKIFLISQDDRLNKLFDSIITVKKTTEGSKICYQSVA